MIYFQKLARVGVFSAILAIFSLSGMALAQSGDAGGEKKALIERILKSQQGVEFDRLLAQLAQSGNPRLVEQLAPRFDTIPAANKENARSQLNQALTAHVADVNAILKQRAAPVLTRVLTPLYEEKFTIEELRTLAVFFESDANRKYQSVASEFAQKLIQGLIQDAQKSVDDKAVAFLKKGEEIMVKAGASSGAPAPAPAQTPRPATSAKK